MNKYNIELCCSSKQIKPLFNDIKYKDYYEAFKRLYNTNVNNLSDDVIHYYIKSRNDISIIIIYPKALKYKDKINELEQDLAIN
jgi:hypothetical protein